MARILVVDDEEPIRFSLRGILEDEGYEVLEASTAEEGLALADSEHPDLVFLDIWLPGMDGLAAQKTLQSTHPDLPVVMISGHGTIETAVGAIQQGAYDFIEKPLSLEKVVIVASRALEAVSLRRENRVLRTALPEQDELIGQSPPMLEFRRLLERVAPTDVWVLLTGENGTGKELAARALHAGSKRASAPMIAVNCAAIPEELIESELFGHEKGAFTSADQARPGRFEMANKGTLFLDEIGDMSLKTQAKILRILQEQAFERVGGSRTIKVDVRVIAATNKNLEDAIAAGTFREDLYYRLRSMRRKRWSGFWDTHGPAMCASCGILRNAWSFFMGAVPCCLLICLPKCGRSSLSSVLPAAGSLPRSPDWPRRSIPGLISRRRVPYSRRSTLPPSCTSVAETSRVLRKP